jgi:hypothetical protein
MIYSKYAETVEKYCLNNNYSSYIASVIIAYNIDINNIKVRQENIDGGVLVTINNNTYKVYDDDEMYDLIEHVNKKEQRRIEKALKNINIPEELLEYIDWEEYFNAQNPKRDDFYDLEEWVPNDGCYFIKKLK